MRHLYRVLVAGLLFLAALSTYAQPATEEFYGTTEPFAAEAVYFVLTDRFANSDEGNDQREQGKAHGNGTWERRLNGPDGQVDFIGYTGGDFKGIYDNAGYIKDMGFTAVWITPIVDNPDEAFTGGSPVQFGSGVGTDGGKTGYHGYWGVNFYQVDEHLESPGFNFQEFAQKMHQDYGLKIVLDIVGNHGSPSWDMKPVDQPKFGEVYDKDGKLLADHQNLEPRNLDPNNPLHRFFNRQPDIAQLMDFNPTVPEVVDYIVGSSLQWIEQGADAFRIDTIKHQPHTFWKQFSDRIRKEHPGFFMFGESYSNDANFIAQHQRPENGGISVLDFPGKESIRNVFQNENSNFADIQGYLHLTDGTYCNPYELATFYDNHDMSRMDASENGFIDAHNWLFTARGIPVVYYGSEMRFMAGKAEHSGNRNPYGKDNMAKARNSAIYKKLAQIAAIRKESVALQKGLQANLQFQGQKAAFYRVYQKDGTNQTALVLLNKGSSPASFKIDKYVSAGAWTDAATNQSITVAPENRVISTTVDPHGVKVLLFNDKVNDPALVAQLERDMKATQRGCLPPVAVDPDPPVAGKPVTVSYYRAGPDNQVVLHWGIDNWSGKSIPQGEVEMKFNEQEGAHQATVTVPAHAKQFDFVFRILPPPPGRWDNNGGRDWHYTVIQDCNAPPLPPENLVATPGDQVVTLQWRASACAISYTIYYTNDNSDPTKASTKLTETNTSYRHERLINGVTYKYRISATNANGESDLSKVVEAKPVPQLKSRFGEGAVLRLTGQAFSNWNPANDSYVLKLVRDYVWEGQINVPTQLRDTPYKLTLNGAWTVNWGGGAAGRKAELNRGGANAIVTLDARTYTLQVTEGTSVDSPVQAHWIGGEEEPKVEVSFTCRNGATYAGQSVYVVGSVVELGNWIPAGAVKLATTQATSPTWTGMIKLPADMAEIKWKCLKREDTDPTKGVQWQSGSDNRLCTTSSCPNTVAAGF